MLGNEYSELLEDGNVLLFSRNGIYQARIYKGDRRYIYRSLKTRKLDEARKLAIKFFYEIEFRKQEALPLQQKTFNAVIDEYVAMRQRDFEHSQTVKINTSTQQHTSVYMLRQIKRVVKFWREYCGKMAVDKIDNAVLQDYIQWRKDYYRRMPANQIPRNAKVDPADKTLEWEVILAKTMLKFASERGYYGTNKQLPTWRYKSASKIVRPAFTDAELDKVIAKLREMADEQVDAEKKYGRQLLLDYVLILAGTGMRVGEANNLKVSDVTRFFDENGKDNFTFAVRGKTGARDVIIKRTYNAAVIRRMLLNEELDNDTDRKIRKNNRKVQNIDSWFFKMYDGNKIITLIDQFQAVLKLLNVEANRYGEKYTLYSLRHYYAVMQLKSGLPVFDLARNMGAKVQIIEQYYGSSAKSLQLATRLSE